MNTVEIDYHLIQHSDNILQGSIHINHETPQLAQQNTFALKSPQPQVNAMYNSLSQSHESSLNTSDIKELYTHRLSELAEKLGPEGLEILFDIFKSNPCI